MADGIPTRYQLRVHHVHSSNLLKSPARSAMFRRAQRERLQSHRVMNALGNSQNQDARAGSPCEGGGLICAVLMSTRGHPPQEHL